MAPSAPPALTRWSDAMLPVFCASSAPQQLVATSARTPGRRRRRIRHLVLPVRQMVLDFPRVPPQQPLDVQHTGTILPRVPRRTIPPLRLATRRQLELQEAHQRQRHEQGLRRDFDRLTRPGPALLPAQALLQIPEAVLLAEPRAEQLHDLQAA